ncbi:unnamed protein product [Cyclocybe aegerita]|uniref:Uncharacterized protein n=1 Tax=Cyclocybe aegerita TaxID=1973307 RepID=A0A8S0VRD0_CYCAE|nr:unnamed protein product [Cyclocybe aegerita]
MSSDDPEGYLRRHLEEMDQSIHRNSYKPGSWAGDRIILLGDYASDFPPSLTQRDVERISKFCQDNKVKFEPARPVSPESRARLTPVELATEEAEYAVRNVYRQLTEVASGHGWHNGRPLNGRLWIGDQGAFPTKVVWVLRNLSKRVYVRSDGFPDMKEDENTGSMEYYYYPDPMKTPGLSQVLYMRCAWSTDDSMATPYEGEPPLHRGLWASDRFDVVLYEDAAETLHEEGWEDVTRELAKEMYGFFKAEYEGCYGKGIYPAWREEPDVDEEE